jgi:hypothetical protein
MADTSRPRRLSSEVEEQLARCESDRVLQQASLDELSRRFKAVEQLIESSDSVPEPLEDEDSLVVHLDLAREAQAR